MERYKNLKNRPKIIIGGYSISGTICFKLATKKP